jgi:tetratricopeptide (TPR) repeat protein
MLRLRILSGACAPASFFFTEYINHKEGRLMKFRFSSTIRLSASATCAALFASVCVVAAPSARVTTFMFAAPVASAQEKDKAKESGPKASDAERKAAQKVKDAKDAAAKFQAASDFVQKFPKSSLRPAIVDIIVDQIANTQDAAQRSSLAENFMNTFAEASEANLMYPILIDSYVAAKRTEDAFNAAATWLESNPNETGVLAVLALVGTDEAQRGNTKFAGQSRQYGLKAIELIEANKKPANMEAATWEKNKAAWLPQLYQATGLHSLMNNNAPDAMMRLQKALSLNPNDPLTYYLMGTIKNDAYTIAAKQFQLMPAGAAKVDAQTKINVQLDEIIDLYAHSIGLTEGKTQFQALHDQLMQDLTSYYKFRHNNSTDGMQKLIDKYKTPATP